MSDLGTIGGVVVGAGLSGLASWLAARRTERHRREDLAHADKLRAEQAEQAAAEWRRERRHAAISDALGLVGAVPDDPHEAGWVERTRLVTLQVDLFCSQDFSALLHVVVEAIVASDSNDAEFHAATLVAPRSFRHEGVRAAGWGLPAAARLELGFPADRETTGAIDLFRKKVAEFVTVIEKWNRHLDDLSQR